MKKMLFFCFLCLTGFGCKTKAPAQQSPPDMTTTELAGKAGFLPMGILFSNGDIYQTVDEILEFQEDRQLDNEKAFSRATFQKVPHDSTAYFELGHYRSLESGENLFAYLIAWKQVANVWLKELEVVYPVEPKPIVNRFSIEMARREWMKYSNENDADQLVVKVYTADAVYFNQGRIFRGTDAIADKYQYMNDPNWEITLEEEAILTVNDKIVFEVGTYKSGGIGHYFLLWQKEEQGPWKALFDFNF